MKRHIDALVREALSDAIQEGHLRTRVIPAFTVDAPRHAAFGDLACDVALVLGRQLGKSPHAIGATIAGRLRDPHGWLAEVGIGGPGFVNFRFAPPFWGAILAEAVEAGAGYGRTDVGQGRRVRVELIRDGASDATGARGAAVADAVAGILRAAGADVERAGTVAGLAPGGRSGPALAARFGQLVGVVAGDATAGLPPLEATLRERGAHGAALRLLPVQAVRVMRDASPAWECPSADELLREIGPDALRFLLLLERAERPVDLDLELAKRVRTDNPLFLVQYARVRLAGRRRGSEAPAQPDPSRLGTADVEVLRALASWPDVMDVASRALEPDRIARFAVELAGATHRWLNRHRPLDTELALGRTRAALSGCLERVLSQALALCKVSAPERM